MSPIYKEAKKCYIEQEFPNFRTERGDDGFAAVYSKDGKFLQVFASRNAAEQEIEKQCAKARKFIA